VTKPAALTAPRDRPLLNSNFRVDFGRGTPRAAQEGFAEIILPEFRIESDTAQDRDAAKPGPPAPGQGLLEHRLILKRGVCGALDLYEWWHHTREGKATRRRSLNIHLLSEDHETVVLTWHFHKVRPVALSYSPLRALEGVVLMETIELAFESFKIT
jgi:phage tail-like protein